MELERLIEVEDLHFSYKNTPVLEGVDFSMRRGEVVSLLGPNGCGKSTLIRLILKLLQGKGGIKLHGKDLKSYSHKEIAEHIAYIPQYHNVPFNYTVLEMVLMGRVAKLGLFGAPSKNDEAKALDSLKRVGIADLSLRPFGQLSGGQKQLVLLARALAQEVNFFIMDEPVNGLDYGNQIRLLELIDSLAKEGYTFLKTTHYPDHALLVSTRVVVLNEGKIVADGEPQEVINSQMIQEIYGVESQIIEHGNHKRCIPTFAKSTKLQGQK
jgi:iron complex transport system ATP-binding protein